MGKKYYCNPLNVNYRYQFNEDQRAGGWQINREAADPSVICFKDRYYIFASMNLSVWVSDDLVNWEAHRLPDNLPLYDYAPDVRVLGDYVYFCASKRGEICNRYRTKDILNGPYEELPGTFDFWDPNLFIDDDGKIYFFWGCTNTEPIWGCELDPVTMNPKTEKVPILYGDPAVKGYERVGEDNSKMPATPEEVEQQFIGFLAAQGMTPETMPPQVKVYESAIKGMFSNQPFIEGPWLDKHKGKYYMQYACPGTQFNTYSDGVYTADQPLGPYTLAENNPYSYKPGGFLPGAGHGSSIRDLSGNWWHVSTMRISINHNFERRVGLWPASFDADGELFCNQRYGDWPFAVTEGSVDPWTMPEWYPLHIGKKAFASSFEEGKEPEKAIEENVQTWWRAACAEEGQWLTVDLEKEMDVRAIQINFADDSLDIPVPGEVHPGIQARYIDEQVYTTQWKLEGSADGENWFTIEDKWEADTDLSHDFVVREEGIQVRFVRLTVRKLPYDQIPAVSGLRIFGIGSGKKPAVPEFNAVRTTDLDMEVTVTDPAITDLANVDPANVASDAEAAGYMPAAGFNILFGNSPEKLYHSYLITGKNSQRVGALIRGREYYVRVDAFNENGITEGKTIKLN